jgi:hypothetical protein
MSDRNKRNQAKPSEKLRPAQTETTETTPLIKGWFSVSECHGGRMPKGNPIKGCAPNLDWNLKQRNATPFRQLGA